jgi:tyrosinase
VADKVMISIGDSDDADVGFLTWVPTRLRLRLAAPRPNALEVELRTRAGSTGRLAYRVGLDDDPSEDLVASLPQDGSPAELFVSGSFGAPSVSPGDAVLEVADRVSGEILGTSALTVRVRKNAESLTAEERQRFLAAMAQLNNQGMGRFGDFRATHTDDTSDEAHGLDAFMPWHRAYLLDLERELQAIDPAVGLPYWRFDLPAPTLFTPEFLGGPDSTTGIARLAPANPLQTWTTDGQIGIVRFPWFDPRTSAAFNRQGLVVSAETVTVGTTGPYGSLRPVFELNPHGRAHTSFFGVISRIGTAARDPLFFLLHCNVDRLWAKWQWFQHRFDAASTSTYPFLGSADDPGATRVGHNLQDTMWPWNNVTGGLRPDTAPRTPLKASSLTPAPPDAPKVGDMIDFQGRSSGVGLGFDYDDVPFE